MLYKSRYLFFFFLLVSYVYGISPQYTLTRPVQQNKISKYLQHRITRFGDSTSLSYWVSFTDKGIFSRQEYTNKLDKLQTQFPNRTLQRRAKVKTTGPLLDFLDIPVNIKYIDKLKHVGIKIRTRSRWFNAVSIDANQQQIRQIEQYPFVVSIEPIESYHQQFPLQDNESTTMLHIKPQSKSNILFDYGNAAYQVGQINVPLLHDEGYYGQGVVVGMLDTGFEHQTNESMTSIRVLQEYDFINNDTITQNQPGDPPLQDSHGTYTLSVLASQKDGQLYGPAFESDYLLAKVADYYAADSEINVEEDRWVQGLEWLEYNGADVVNSSLGYLNYDNITSTLTYTQMDGTTHPVSQAAEIAYYDGVVVCDAMGNNGSDTTYPYMLAPADGYHVISVGAVDASGAKTWFSSIGPTYDDRTKPDVMALGQYVYHALNYTTTGYALSSGTSLSTPLVTGVVALLLQIHPNWRPQDVINALHATSSQSISPDNYKGWGVVDAYAASQYVPPVYVPYWQWFY